MHALIRPISDSLADCALTHLERVPIDLDIARRQHAAYTECLARLGCHIVTLPAAPALPDAVFVEDTAVVLDDVAVITRPGHVPRRLETPAVEEALRPHRAIERIEEPGTLDGGDVLTAGRTIFVGRTERTNDAGIEQLRAIATPRGYAVQSVDVRGCLHLKSACTLVGPGMIVLNPEWVDRNRFDEFDLLEVDPGEPWAGNQLRVGDTVVCPAAFPRTAARLAANGLDVLHIAADELAKAEGGVSCCSILFDA